MLRFQEKPSDSAGLRQLLRQYVHPHRPTTWQDLEHALLDAPAPSDHSVLCTVALLVLTLVLLCLPMSCNAIRIVQVERVAKTAIGSDW